MLRVPRVNLGAMEEFSIVYILFLIFCGAALLATLAMTVRQSLIIAYIGLGLLIGPWGLNLLSDIGESKVVILSTHIVDDVTNLCPRMAIIAKGQIVREGRPSDLINGLRGSVWAKTVERQEVEPHNQRHNVISTKLYAGLSILHVLSDTDPGDGFEAHEPDLEDVYFSTLASVNGNVAKAA